MLIRSLAAVMGLFTAGCSATQPLVASDRPQPIVIDGADAEWPAASPVEAVADDRHLFVRFAPASGEHAIQAAPFTTRILIDTDDQPGTGMPIAGLGVDVGVLLSPPNQNGTGVGSQVMLYGPDGFGSSTGHAQLGFLFLPTHASEVYEARIDRGSLPRATSGPIRVRVDQVMPDGTVIWSATTATTLPDVSITRRDTGSLPPPTPGSVRVLALNVLFSAPLNNPAPFRRMIRAIDPEVILFQEWFNQTQPVIQNWVNTNLGPGWTVIAPSTNGIAIATRLPVLETIPRPLADSGPGADARFAAAVLDTRIGPMIAGSLHLKCCGSAGSSEDQRRIAEAQAINATIADILTRHPGASIAIGGDYNLVGSRTPLETLAAGLGATGADLAPSTPIVLGDATAVTWVDERSMFSPGRLDWILYDPAASRAARAFGLDTRRLSPAALQRSGMMADDSRASDHLPVVIDLTR